MLVCTIFDPIAHETAGAARTRHSLRPLTTEGGKLLAKLGRNASRECSRILGVVPAQAGTQYSRDADDEPIGRGVLGPRFRGDDSGVLAL